ncbi:Protein fmp52, mitochondrial [Mortierella alpina]|uniref:Protein fmp52, mitochondrial n=1 Tax=Mortierella alpina TaxID=64518 RepID=A0A9P6M7A6_MORAP|nr:Protein fmp52, mitochondrial [Mortierella alpina]
MTLQSKTQETPLVLGGTGAVGKCVVRDALASNAFTRVLTLGRRPVSTDDTFSNLSVLEQKTVSLEDIPATFPASDLPQIVFCTLGTTRAAAGSAEAFRKIDQQYVLDSARYIHEKAPKNEDGTSKVHYLYVSAANANSKSFFLYSKVKGETEKALAEIGFERVSILQPSFLKVVEPRDSGNRMAEWAVDRISVAVVAQSMRLIATADSPEAEGVKPRLVEVHPTSKSTVAFYSNPNIHDIVQKHSAASKL